MIKASSEAASYIKSVISPSSSIVISCSPLPEEIFIRILFAPVISFEFSNGDASAFSIAFIALFSPAALPIPIIETPEFFITVSTSAKSTLI